jgi:hypothetical protein
MLEKPAAAQDALGAPQGFEAAGEAWGVVEPLTPAAAGEPQPGQGAARLRVRVRAAVLLAPGWRLRLSGRAYRILSVSPALPRQSERTLECEEEPQ